MNCISHSDWTLMFANLIQSRIGVWVKLSHYYIVSLIYFNILHISPLLLRGPGRGSAQNKISKKISIEVGSWCFPKNRIEIGAWRLALSKINWNWSLVLSKIICVLLCLSYAQPQGIIRLFSFIIYYIYIFPSPRWGGGTQKISMCWEISLKKII